MERKITPQLAGLIGLGAITACIMGVCIGILAIIWEGFVLVQLWNWFILPYFQIPALTIPLAIGLIVTVRLVTQQIPAKNTTSPWFFMFLRPSIMLGIGWVVKFYFLG